MQNGYLYSRISCYLMSAIDKMYIPCIFALYIYMLAASALCLGRDGTLVNLWSGLKDYFTSCVLLWMLCGQDLKTFTLCVFVMAAMWSGLKDSFTSYVLLWTVMWSGLQDSFTSCVLLWMVMWSGLKRLLL